MTTSKSDPDITGEIQVIPGMTQHEWQEQVTRALNRQARIEAERTGATKLMNKLIVGFGALITTAAISAFAWLWNTQQEIQKQNSDIAHVVETQGEQMRFARDLENRVSETERNEQEIGERLDNQGQTLNAILGEVRNHRRN